MYEYQEEPSGIPRQGLSLRVQKSGAFRTAVFGEACWDGVGGQ